MTAKEEKAAHKEEVKELKKIAKNDIASLFPDGKGAYVRSGSDRGCTDCYCCVIFGAYWLLMCYLIYFATQYGDMDRLIKPKDMDANTCGMETYQGGTMVNMEEYPALYMPTPADETIQICVKGCPGGTTGTCFGNATTDYLVGPGGVPLPGADLAASAFGSLGAMAGVKLPGPDGYDREADCIAQGDCSTGDLDVAMDDCVLWGKCLYANGTVNNDNMEKRNCLYDQFTLEETGYSFEPNEWTPFTWENNEEEGMFICQPPEMASSPPASMGYPPKDFMTASIRGWLKSEGPCWMPVFPAKDILFRCVPSMLKDMMNPDKLGETAQGQQAVQAFMDLQNYWKVIPFGGLVAVLASFAWIVFLSKFAGLVIWASVYGLEILLPCISLACWWQLGLIDTRTCKASALDADGKPVDEALGKLCSMADVGISEETWPDYSYTGQAEINCLAASCMEGPIPPFTLPGEACAYEPDDCTYTSGVYVEIPPEVQAEMDKANTDATMTYNIAVGSLVAWVVLGIIFFIFQNRIRLAIGVIEEASDAFLDIPAVIFLPVIVLVISLPVTIFCTVALVMLSSLRWTDPSTGLPTWCLDPAVLAQAIDDGALPPQIPQDPQPPAVDAPHCLVLQGMLAGTIFGGIWTLQWFKALQYLTVAGAISRWYFTPTIEGSKDVPHFLLADGVRRTLRHHMGTAAFGSFIVAVVICVKYIAVCESECAASFCMSALPDGRLAPRRHDQPGPGAVPGEQDDPVLGQLPQGRHRLP